MSNLDPKPMTVALDGEEAEAGDFAPVMARKAPVGESTTVARYFPNRARTTVGAWCFLDHYGPDDVAGGPGMRVGPHPHTGLQTVTWLVEGEVVHHDSLGNRQTIRPGQLDLMTAGSGIAHAERSPAARPPILHGLQLWVALPDAHRDVAPAFEHHPSPPKVDLDGARATVLVGEVAGARSTATAFSPLVGADLDVWGRTAVPLEPGYEHAVLVTAGRVAVEGRPLVAGACVYLGRGRDRLGVAADPAGRVVLLGGEPLGEPLVMWWNFVGRTSDEVAEARADWEAGRRFGHVSGDPAERIAAPAFPAGRLRARGPGPRPPR